MSAFEDERSRSWHLAMASVLLPGWRDEGNERRFLNSGGLSINRRSGAWICRSSGHGGYATVGLIQFIKDYSEADARAWITAFLAEHPGTGECSGDTKSAEGSAAAVANRLRAKDILVAAVPVEGTPGEAYLRGRGLEPAYPECVKFLPEARTGEGALVGQLTAHDRVVGVQLTYLDPVGRKSLVLPVRRRARGGTWGGFCRADR